MNKNTKPSKALVKTDVSGSYVGTQTPIERLRNKLSPFITIVELLDGNDDIVSPFIEHTRIEERKNELFESLVKTCAEYKGDIKTHLSDCEKFYSKNDVNGFPTKKVCFFKIENGKYLTDNGMEISNDMLIKHSHYIGFPWNYIVLE